MNSTNKILKIQLVDSDKNVTTLTFPKTINVWEHDTSDIVLLKDYAIKEKKDISTLLYKQFDCTISIQAQKTMASNDEFLKKLFIQRVEFNIPNDSSYEIPVIQLIIKSKIYELPIEDEMD